MRFASPLVIAGSLAVASFTSAPAAHAATLYKRLSSAACYARTYQPRDFSNPNRYLHAVAVQIDPHGPADGTANKASYFAVRFAVQMTRQHFLYTATAYCSPKGAGYDCQVEADGGSFRLISVGKGVRLITSRVYVEGATKDLELVAPSRSPRSFTLRRAARSTCAKFLQDE